MDIALIQGIDPSAGGDLAVSYVFSLIQGHWWMAQIQDNLFNNIGQAWANFIQSGQVWALIIGFVVGYIFRSITAY